MLSIYRRISGKFENIVGEEGLNYLRSKTAYRNARALLKNPSILILDEATSSLTVKVKD
jgi:ABC-type multidrug transport system fused ATPase/permease subunit